MVAGVDVGGPRKGFHAVILHEGKFVAKMSSREAHHIAAWCRAQGATVVAVDAPCRWRTSGLARAAERELAKEKISRFSTPTEARATDHPFFTWMIAGQALFRALHVTHPICSNTGSVLVSRSRHSPRQSHALWPAKSSQQSKKVLSGVVCL